MNAVNILLNIASTIGWLFLLWVGGNYNNNIGLLLLAILLFSIHRIRKTGRYLGSLFQIIGLCGIVSYVVGTAILEHDKLSFFFFLSGIILFISLFIWLIDNVSEEISVESTQAPIAPPPYNRTSNTAYDAYSPVSAPPSSLPYTHDDNSSVKKAEQHKANKDRADHLDRSTAWGKFHGQDTSDLFGYSWKKDKEELDDLKRWGY